MREENLGYEHALWLEYLADCQRDREQHKPLMAPGRNVEITSVVVCSRRGCGYYLTVTEYDFDQPYVNYNPEFHEDPYTFDREALRCRRYPVGSFETKAAAKEGRRQLIEMIRAGEDWRLSETSVMECAIGGWPCFGDRDDEINETYRVLIQQWIDENPR